MSPTSVEYLLTHEARLLARRDSPVIDHELEATRQQALNLFFQFQDGMKSFEDLIPFVAVLQQKVELNRVLLKWEQEHLMEE